MSKQGTDGRSDGSFARQALGRVVNSLLDYFQHSENLGTISDTNNAALYGGTDISWVGLAVVIDTSNNSVALYEIQGGGGGTSLLASGQGSFGTTKGTDAQTNVYYDTDQYEIENQTGGDADYKVITIREP